MKKKKFRARRDSGDYEKAPFLNTLLDHAGHDMEEVLSDAVSFMVGGFHTSGNFMCWVLHYLSIYPEIQERVFKEVSEVLSGQDQDLDEEGMKKLV